MTAGLTADIADRTGAWLANSWTEEYRSDPQTLHLSIALGHLCHLLDNRTTNQIRFEINAADLNFASSPLIISLVSCLALLGSEDQDVRARAVEYVLALHASEENAAGKSVRVALHGLRAAEPGEDPPLVVRDLENDPAADRVHRALHMVEQMTAYGLLPADEPLQAAILEGAGIMAARKYDLTLAARALRARFYLSAKRTLGTDSLSAFLRESQNSDGSFGAYDTAFARLALDGRPEAIRPIEIHTAFNCLWALAEADDNEWRLHRQAFGQGLLHRAMS